MNQNVFKTTERFRTIRVDSCGGAAFVQETGPTERAGHPAVSRRKTTTLKNPSTFRLQMDSKCLRERIYMESICTYAVCKNNTTT